MTYKSSPKLKKPYQSSLLRMQLVHYSNSELHDLYLTLYYTWKIPFKGNLKVAILDPSLTKGGGGVSIVNYTTPLPCTGLSKSDSELYINFGFCEGKNFKHLKNTLIYKAKQSMLSKNISRKVYIF